MKKGLLSASLALVTMLTTAALANDDRPDDDFSDVPPEEDPIIVNSNCVIHMGQLICWT